MAFRLVHIQEIAQFESAPRNQFHEVQLCQGMMSMILNT